jgi:hypothetical protein
MQEEKPKSKTFRSLEDILQWLKCERNDIESAPRGDIEIHFAGSKITMSLRKFNN